MRYSESTNGGVVERLPPWLAECLGRCPNWF
jgi:hypothetical protein